MSIRIDYLPYGTKPLVRIAGRLTSTDVPQLMQTFSTIEDSFVIDLSDLLYADSEGINAIRAIVDKGVQLQGTSPFVKLLIETHQGSTTDCEDL